MAFAENLEFGQAGESVIARWIRHRGASVLPAYEKEIDTGKGPRLFTPSGELVVPDLLAFLQKCEVVFIEAKHKSVFTWHHKTQRWCTGIDRHHYEDYQKVEQETRKPVWLLFLHEHSTPSRIDLDGRDDCPKCRAARNTSRRHSCCPNECPTGLYGRSLAVLKDNENHRDPRWGRYGMVYWSHAKLKLLASLDELRECGAL